MIIPGRIFGIGKVYCSEFGGRSETHWEGTTGRKGCDRGTVGWDGVGGCGGGTGAGGTRPRRVCYNLCDCRGPLCRSDLWTA